MKSGENKPEYAHYMQLFSVCAAAVLMINEDAKIIFCKVLCVQCSLGSCLSYMFIDHNQTWNEDQ